MTDSLSIRDRLRIERVVWAVDSRLQDLPRKSRASKRRELRDNLRAAAIDVGADEAIRGLGDARHLAADFLAAEYGDGARRPSWSTAAAAFAVGYLALTGLLDAGTTAFRDGVVATDPSATGAFTWTGIPYILDDVKFNFVDGSSTHVGGAWTPITYAILFVVVVAAGRFWRLIPAFGRRTT